MKGLHAIFGSSKALIEDQSISFSFSTKLGILFEILICNKKGILSTSIYRLGAFLGKFKLYARHQDVADKHLPIYTGKGARFYRP